MDTNTDHVTPARASVCREIEKSKRRGVGWGGGGEGRGVGGGSGRGGAQVRESQIKHIIIE